jgi:outer membrane protein
MGGGGLPAIDAAAQTGKVQLRRFKENAMSFVRFLRIMIISGLTVALASAQNGGAARHLTLTEAVRLAITQNRSLKIARLKVAENEQKKAGERSQYFPTITNQSNLLHITELQKITIPGGAFGAAGGQLIPPVGVSVDQGKNTLYSSGTMIAQPLTQLIRIHAANQAAAADLIGSRDELKKAEDQVALQVHSLYFGILITRLQKAAAEQQAVYAGERLRESEDDVRNGSALKIATIEGHAGVLEGEQSLLTAELQLSDLTTELNDLLGLPLNTPLELDPAVPANFEQHPKEEYVQTAWAGNPEILAAEEAVHKARAGVAAAKTAYIPDITAYARQSYQNGVPFFVRNFGDFGLHLNWTVFDFAKRRAVVREREDQLAQAEQNVERLKNDVAVRIERSYNKLERTRHMVQVAQQVVQLRKEGLRLANNQLIHDVVLAADEKQANAAAYKAEADYLQADLGYLLAWAELEQTVGRTPGL